MMWRRDHSGGADARRPARRPTWHIPVETRVLGNAARSMGHTAPAPQPGPQHPRPGSGTQGRAPAPQAGLSLRVQLLVRSRTV